MTLATRANPPRRPLDDSAPASLRRGSWSATTVLSTLVAKHGTISRPIALAGVSYDAATNAMKLTPRGKLPRQMMQSTVDASLIKDANGNLLAGNRNGQPGTNFVAALNSRGVIRMKTVRVSAPWPRSRPGHSMS